MIQNVDRECLLINVRKLLQGKFIVSIIYTLKKLFPLPPHGPPQLHVGCRLAKCRYIYSEYNFENTSH